MAMYKLYQFLCVHWVWFAFHFSHASVSIPHWFGPFLFTFWFPLMFCSPFSFYVSASASASASTSASSYTFCTYNHACLFSYSLFSHSFSSLCQLSKSCCLDDTVGLIVALSFCDNCPMLLTQGFSMLTITGYVVHFITSWTLYLYYIILYCMY